MAVILPDKAANLYSAIAFFLDTHCILYRE